MPFSLNLEKNLVIKILNLLARFSQKELFLDGGQLNHTRLGRFVLIAFLLHASVVIFQLLVSANSENPLAPPPIKVKYVAIQIAKNEIKTIEY